MGPIMQNLPRGIRQSVNNYQNTGFVRDVQDNELTSNQLNNLTNADSKYIRSARGRGASYAQARGNLNSSLAAANAEQAAIDAALPIATQDAAAYANAASQNLDSLGRQQIASEGNATQLENTRMETGSRESIAANQLLHDREQAALDRRWRTGEREADQGWRTSEREGEQGWRTSERQGDERFRSRESGLDRDWRSRESELDRMFQTNMNRLGSRNSIFGEIVGTVFSDPAYWRDQAGAAGFIQTWTDTLTPLFDRIFNQGSSPGIGIPAPPMTPPTTPLPGV